MSSVSIDRSPIIDVSVVSTHYTRAQSSLCWSSLVLSFTYVVLLKRGHWLFAYPAPRCPIGCKCLKVSCVDVRDSVFITQSLMMSASWTLSMLYKRSPWAVVYCPSMWHYQCGREKCFYASDIVISSKLLCQVFCPAISCKLFARDNSGGTVEVSSSDGNKEYGSFVYCYLWL